MNPNDTLARNKRFYNEERMRYYRPPERQQQWDEIPMWMKLFVPFISCLLLTLIIMLIVTEITR